VGATRRPLHLLLLDETFTHQLVHRRLHEGRADPYPYISIPDPTRRGGIYLFDQYRLVIGGVGIVYDGESRSEAQTRFHFDSKVGYVVQELRNPKRIPLLILNEFFDKPPTWIKRGVARSLNRPQRERLPFFKYGISVVKKIKLTVVTCAVERFAFSESQGAE